MQGHLDSPVSLLCSAGALLTVLTLLVTGAWSVATSPPHDRPLADCKSTRRALPRGLRVANRHRFAFVEYEDRRDADDAYHEMHNKRLGRDDMLKIEVSHSCPYGSALLLTAW